MPAHPSCVAVELQISSTKSCFWFASAWPHLLYCQTALLAVMGNNGLSGERSIYKYGVITLKSWEVLALPPLPNAIISMTVIGVGSIAVTPASSCIGYTLIFCTSWVSIHPHHCFISILLPLPFCQVLSLDLTGSSHVDCFAVARDCLQEELWNLILRHTPIIWRTSNQL